MSSSLQVEKSCFALSDDETHQSLLSELNESQRKAICACLSSLHCSKSTVDLISGPPGSGKTKTLGTLLFALLKMNCRTLVSAPTNIAIKEVAYLKVGAEIEEIYLDYHVKKLSQCFKPLNGWKHCFVSMIDLLENCVSHYHMFIENEMRKEQDHFEHDNSNGSKHHKPSCSGVRVHKSFLEFVEERFLSIASPLKDSVSLLCMHLPRSCILEQNSENMASLIWNLESFRELLLMISPDQEGLPRSW
ncbi:hypothetical protein KIW84_070046 [Lathyrus oleraceus]|uniref:DNA2/NAM7 helicase helicase domain-containing protein n=1 Tax=Pisum sativum TaxID=3888 RepID=A0A9D4VGQ8_PEA|nr:hypothetical protein KIW84_UN0215 [Pisum sativum]KAI5382471.1 hypothetical protein KIW84_070046 [Pisum sativum]